MTKHCVHTKELERLLPAPAPSRFTSQGMPKKNTSIIICPECGWGFKKINNKWHVYDREGKLHHIDTNPYDISWFEKNGCPIHGKISETEGTSKKKTEGTANIIGLGIFGTVLFGILALVGFTQKK